MAYSYVNQVADGATDTFNFSFLYERQADIHVYLDGVETTAFTFPTTQSVQLDAGDPPDQTVVQIRRISERDERLVNYEDASVLTEADLDKDSNQMFWLVQEGLDVTTDDALTIPIGEIDYDASGLKIVDLGDPVDAQDAATLAYGEANWGGAAAEAAEAAQTAAETAQTGAETAETNAAATYDSFDDRYLGAKAADPTLDNDGDALLTGALYFNTTVSQMKVYTGSAWVLLDVITTAFTETLLDDADAASFMDTLGITTFAQTVLDDANASTARATLVAQEDVFSAQGDLVTADGSVDAVRIAKGAEGTILRAGASLPYYTDGVNRTAAQATTSGGEVDFTDIPSWVRRITVIAFGAELSGSDPFLVQIGDSGGFESNAYVSNSVMEGAASAVASGVTTGYLMTQGAGGGSMSGTMTLVNISGDTWIEEHTMYRGSDTAVFGGGSKTLSTTLDRVRWTRSGTDTLDGGSVAVLYE